MSPIEIVPGLEVGPNRGLVLFGGPCAIEGEDFTLEMAASIRNICARLGVGFVFKSSFDKANRTSLESYRGPGLGPGLAVLKRVRDEVGVPVITDIHEPAQAAPAAAVAAVLQIPAFLCRQTDLLLAAGGTGRVVNVKKGQFVSPPELAHAVAKIESTGNRGILLTERGSAFGYNNLVVDFRSLPQLGAHGYPVVFDATHSVQMPGALGSSSGGQREYVPLLARAAVAVGVDALFMEIHKDPDRAMSDGPNMVPLADLEALLTDLLALRQARVVTTVAADATASVDVPLTN
jgi:2-dehydro-3-deoxyphosphooctonate aldolase (KDO 8-P synthase)